MPQKLPPSFTPALRDEYAKLFATAKINPERLALVDAQAKGIALNKSRYEAIAKQVGKCPWWVIGLLHMMESNCDFSKHLHNGDPLTARTVQVPKDRPTIGKPPFTFEQSALDALRLKSYHTMQDFTIPMVLYRFEGYNGYGYRMYHPNVKTPYLWSFTNHYKVGKYVADGKWSDTEVSRQTGIAAVLRRMVDLKLVTFA